jgi:N-acetylglucosamine-6-phosphate deacetylase
VRLRSERIVCPGGTIAGEVVIEGGRIAGVRSVSGGGSELIELGESWIVPGYIDMHLHGGSGAQCNTESPEEIDRVAHFHTRHGTTGLLATLAPAPMNELIAALRAVATARAPTVLGAHLEGPFLSPEQPGALDPSHFLAPEPALLELLLAAAPGAVRVMTLAPELPRAGALVEKLADAGVVASLGHTAATYAQARDAITAGATSATHVFNAMPPLHHRAPGVLGAVLATDEVSCELICDGVHVDPVAMRLLYKAKRATGIRLVTDATAAAGMPDGEYRLAGRDITVRGPRAVLAGTEAIAGSTLTMARAVQSAVSLMGIAVEDAVQMASANPARLLGLDGRKGAIAAGCDADLVVLNERLAVTAVMVAGRWVADRA